MLFTREKEYLSLLLESTKLFVEMTGKAGEHLENGSVFVPVKEAGELVGRLDKAVNCIYNGAFWPVFRDSYLDITFQLRSAVNAFVFLMKALSYTGSARLMKTIANQKDHIISVAALLSDISVALDENILNIKLLYQDGLKEIADVRAALREYSPGDGGDTLSYVADLILLQTAEHYLIGLENTFHSFFSLSVKRPA